MDAARWQKLQALFLAARALDGDARERLLQEHAARDPDLAAQARALVAADAEPGMIDALAPQLASLAHVLREATPRRIGAYRIVRELGRGGMGLVYLADRADGEFQQRVAVKLIDATDADDPRLQRFRAERQILAALTHPHIARLLDGGVTEDGRPYLVMEYVDGLPITTHCDEHRLDVPARLRLFADVCAAVQHAHQNLVIHRDLKPSNILVSTDGRVHLLDFGIAKLINPVLTAVVSPPTRLDSRLMTPEYASPEQVRGQSLTTASDIYSLGVLLYELLCGSPPYDLASASPGEIATAVCEQDPERPSVRAMRAANGRERPDTIAHRRGMSADRLAGLLDGDLDGIVLMAMRKEPGRRYASADMLRQDVERYLSGLPVLAHRGSRRYRLMKLLRRHRVEATAATLVAAALVAGLSVAIAQGQRASRERDRAEQALSESDGVARFLLDLFQSGDPADPLPAQLSAFDLLQRGARRADELAEPPLVHARVLDVVGQMSLHLGQLDEAQRRLEQAVAIRRSTPGASTLDLANSLIHLARVHRARAEYDPARTLVSEALEIRRSARPPNHPDIGEALFELGWLMAGPNQERLYREALTILTDAPPTAERRVTLLQALSTNLRRQGHLDEAVATDREALAVAERTFGPDHHTTGYAMIHLADHVRDIEQDMDGAERLYRRGIELMTRRFGDSSIRLLHGLNSLARLLADRGDDEAEALYRRTLAISQAATGPDHPEVARQMAFLAGDLARQGRASEAEPLARQALELSIRTMGPQHHHIPWARMPLIADVLDLQGRYEEADEMYRNALELAHQNSVMGGELHRSYGLLLLRRGDQARAERQLLQSLARLEEAYGGSDHPNVQETKRALMELYRRLGQPDAVARYRVPPGRFIPY
jgi:eukaryotic-like serine/threonine-protein kinase